jgi:hypothetical protein
MVSSDLVQTPFSGIGTGFATLNAGLCCGCVIRKISADGTVSTFAGKSSDPGSRDGAKQDARFSSILRLAIGPGNLLYEVDVDNLTVRLINGQGTVTTLAGKAGEFGN